MESNIEQGNSPIGQTAQPEAVKSEEPEIIVQKMAEGSVDGQVACGEGPVLNAVVSIGMNNTYTDSRGNFLLEHVPPGIGKIRVKPPVTRFYDYNQDILVEADKKNNLFIFLTEVTGIVEGTITDESGKPLVGAEVSGLFRLGKDAIISMTDEKGHYIFNEIPRGAYYVRAKALGFMTEGADVNVTGGNNSVISFKLKAASLSITGRVTGKNGVAIDCEIYLMRRGIVVTKGKTTKESDGKFAFADLISDNYEIGVLSPGYNGRGWSGKLEKPEVVNFELEEMIEPPNTSSGFNH